MMILNKKILQESRVSLQSLIYYVTVGNRNQM